MNKEVIIATATGLMALGLINISIFEKEQLLSEGEVVLLELAPVDPRSLMQGDYMELNFMIGNDIRSQLRNREPNPESTHLSSEFKESVVVVSLDQNAVGRFSSLKNGQKLSADERFLKYRIRNGRVKFATNAFFFQEGKARIYEQARYGEFRVAPDGDLLLTGMRSQSFEKLGVIDKPGDDKAVPPR
ncbi:MAG: GDYXXLXY domain-containing protein [Gammaproteobacteria bacterium]|nr:GDYXXLXY domain-containing protein [Gammaproteobacteria bacterium]